MYIVEVRSTKIETGLSSSLYPLPPLVLKPATVEADVVLLDPIHSKIDNQKVEEDTNQVGKVEFYGLHNQLHTYNYYHRK
jgi:hypothetical protein